jgi:hypothetical protein
MKRFFWEFVIIVGLGTIVCAMIAAVLLNNIKAKAEQPAEAEERLWYGVTEEKPGELNYVARKGERQFIQGSIAKVHIAGAGNLTFSVAVAVTNGPTVFFIRYFLPSSYSILLNLETNGPIWLRYWTAAPQYQNCRHIEIHIHSVNELSFD